MAWYQSETLEPIDLNYIGCCGEARKQSVCGGQGQGNWPVGQENAQETLEQKLAHTLADMDHSPGCGVKASDRRLQMGGEHQQRSNATQGIKEMITG